jgi:hypothetical protein
MFLKLVPAYPGYGEDNMFTKMVLKYTIWVFLALVLTGCAGQKPIRMGNSRQSTRFHQVIDEAREHEGGAP